MKHCLPYATLVALLPLASLVACHASQTPSAGGNSNWLSACETSADCAQGTCACGVCTTSCQSDAECDATGEDAACVDPSIRGIASDCAQLADATGSEGAASLCLLACTDDSGCDRGQRCLQGACVDTSALTAVGRVDGPCDGDGSCDDTLVCMDSACVAASTEPEPCEGVACEPNVTCTGGSCETEARLGERCGADVTCVAGLECLNATCMEPAPVEPALQLGEACPGDGCADALSCERGVCAEPWSGVGCTAAASNRPACGADDACPSGLLCHIDGTCIEPGRCDAAGETTLLDGGDGKLIGLTSSHLVLRYPETRDALNNPRGDARFVRLPPTGGTVETIAEGLAGPLEAQLVGDALIFAEGGDLWQVPVDGSRAPQPLGIDPTLWHADATHVYYVLDREIRRVDRSDPASDEQLAPDTLAIPVQLLVDDTTLHVLGDTGELLAMPKSGGTLEMLTQIETFVPSASLGPQRIFVSSDGSVYSIDRSGGDRYTVVLDDLATRVRSHREYVYFHGFGGFKRAPKQPGDSTMLAATPPSRVEDELDAQDFAIGDAGHFRFHEGRLVRLVLPDLSAAETPQGDRGAPCFDDGLCNDGNVCVDLICSAN